MTTRLPHLLCALLALALSTVARAGTVQVAVAANFTEPAKVAALIRAHIASSANT